MRQHDFFPTQSPLDASKTVVAEDPNGDNNLSITQEEDHIQRIQAVQLTAQNKSKKHNDDFSNEYDLELQSIASNETVRNEALTTEDAKEKQAMFANDDLDYPEGGFQAYLVVFGAFMGLIPCFGLLNSLGAIETYVTENQLADVPSSTTAWIFSIFLFINFTSCIFSGTFFDRNGARTPLIAGAILLCGGIFATANCTKVWQFILAFGVVAGFGNGTTLSPLVSVVPHYFNRKRGLFISIASTGGSIGGIVFPIMLRKLFEQVGYVWTMRIFAFVIMACHAFAIAFARERLPHIKTDRTTFQKVLSYATAFDAKAFKDYKFILVTLGCTFAEVSVTTTSTYYTSYSRAQGVSLSTAYLLTTLVNIGGIPGRWLTGYLSDRVGRFNVMICTLTFTCAVILVILLPFGHHPGALYAFSIIWGFSTGSIFSLLSVCCGQICKTEDFGKRYSTMYFIVAFGTMASVPVGGAIIGNRSVAHFNNFMIFCAITAIASAAFYYAARVLCVGPGLRKRF